MSDSDEMADSIEIETGLGRTAHISLREFEECLNTLVWKNLVW